MESPSCAEVKTTNPGKEMKGGLCVKRRKPLKAFTREKEKENDLRVACDQTVQNGRRNGKTEELLGGEIMENKRIPGL